MWWRTVMVVGALLGAAAGCDSHRCGAGTHEERGACVADVGCSCGPGTGPAPTDAGCYCVPFACDGGACQPVAPAVGSCWTKTKMIRPCVSQTVDQMFPVGCPPETPNFVLATRSDDGGVSLAGGQAVPVATSETTYTVYGVARPLLLDGQPGWVPLVAVPDAGVATAPGAQRVELAFELVAGKPLVRLHDVSVAGLLDGDARPASGSLVGCLSATNATGIYFDKMGETLFGILEACGAALDCDATGSGALDGITLELQWSASQAADVY